MTSNQPQQPFQPQGPHAYGTPTAGSTTTPPTPLPQPPAKASRLGMIALITAVVGFVFAVWEGAYIVGWVLLPIAFILSLVALFTRKQTGLAVTALIVSIVGFVAGALAFTATVNRVFDETFGGTPTVVPAAPSGQASDSPATDQPAAEASAGTRENPHPLGTTISNDKWQVTVNSVTKNATDQVMAENEFNDEPKAGQAYALINVTVTRVGKEAASPLFDVSVNWVTSEGNVITEADAVAVAPDALSTNDLFTGASATGNVALLLPEGDNGTVRVTPGILSDEVFFAGA